MTATGWTQNRLPTDAEIERAQRQYRHPTEQEVNAARQKYGAPPRELERGASTQSPLKVEALPTPQGNIDVEGLARRYEENRKAFEHGKGYTAGQPALLMFVTLTMPQETLKLLVAQASRTGATIVIRGLKNASLRQTAAHIQQLIGQSNVQWLIDPPAFDRFAVTQVPTIVLVKAGTSFENCATGSCISPHAFVAIAGDVSIDYAMEAVARRAPQFKAEAELFRKLARN